MEFPEVIVSIIKEYAMPLTRPDWRSLHRMPSHRFHTSVAQTFNHSMPQALFELTCKDGPEYKYHIEFYGGLPYVVYIYGPNIISFYLPY